MTKTKVRELILKYEDGSEARVTFGLPASDCESNGEWPSITEDGVTTDFSEHAQAFLLDAGAFHSYRGWDANDTVHDPNCDCPEMTIDRAVNRAKREILLDVAQGKVPASKITSFADLHDYVDANEYGGLTEDEPWVNDDEAVKVQDTFLNQDFMEAANEVQNRVDSWIKDGGLR